MGRPRRGFAQRAAEVLIDRRATADEEEEEEEAEDAAADEEDEVDELKAQARSEDMHREVLAIVALMTVYSPLLRLRLLVELHRQDAEKRMGDAEKKVVVYLVLLSEQIKHVEM